MFCPKFSRDSSVGFLQKTILREFFINFVKTKASTKILEISPYFLQKNSGSILRWKIPKKITQVLSYVDCTLVRRNVHKEITKWRYREENPIRFVFENLVLFTLGLGLTTSYSLGLELFTRHSSLCVLSFGWDLSPKFFPQELQ